MQTSVNDRVAAELRVASARTQTTASGIAAELAQNPMWVSRRLRGQVELTLSDVADICRAMGIDPIQVLAAALPAPASTP
jgi:hypothetical protein